MSAQAAERPRSLPVPTERPDVPRRLSTQSAEDALARLGAALGSLGLCWLLYVQVLGWSGRLGFVVVWFGLFLGLYAAVTAMAHPTAVVSDRLVGAVVLAAASLVAMALAATVYDVLVRGWTALHHQNFFTQDMAGVRPTAPLTHGGIRHALLGTAIQVAIASAISLPLGIGTAVFLTEVPSRWTAKVRSVVEAMTALPDILAGLFVYAVLVIGLHMERDGFAAAVALSVTMTPIIARSAEVVLRLVPGGLREAGLALGASRWQTVRRVVLPTARAGLATSLILGIARVAGETAPLLIVSGASTFTNTDPFHDPMTSLPLFVFSAIRSGEPAFIERGYGAAAVLLVFVLVLFLTARLLTRSKVRSR